MRDPILTLTGAAIVAVAIGLAIVLARGGSRAGAGRSATEEIRQEQATARGVGYRWGIAGCAAAAAAGLDVAIVHGIGTSPTAGSGITVELGFAMMGLAVVWFIFRHHVLSYQLRIAAALYDTPDPAEPEQVRAADAVGRVLRLVLFLPGLFIVLAKLILRY
ncbi:hypothetical protein [Pseudarthrobacter sp. NIBRBAC000502770]|uniref:hypothetical protein n=1 Tax=Pseudarthrobacter sp. NIBRBAC000502770 TaxID=2590785 RepID=UPI00114063BF|nr:hypothetical protein [Pseudarthrobacter sp. NIBRBAC000502770]QDG88119.1 hypothetical protein NIBR502770_06220 [Pseudarthrobacter sp. NIBRBAC000502770]